MFKSYRNRKANWVMECGAKKIKGKNLKRRHELFLGQGSIKLKELLDFLNEVIKRKAFSSFRQSYHCKVENCDPLDFKNLSTFKAPKDHPSFLRRVCRKHKLLLGGILLIAMPIEASLFYKKHSEGWLWYETKPKETKTPVEKETPTVASKTPTQEVEALKKELNDLLNKAILYPTPENVIHYKRKQEVFMEQSHEFARTWQKVTFENPDLDYSLKFPTQHTARLIYKEEEGRAKDQVLRTLSKDYGLFYIFRSDCRYCESFAPVVKGFAQKYGWSVFAISGDGGPSSAFPKAQINNGIIENLKIETFPALIAVHPETGKVIPLAYGMTSLSDIETRAYSLERPMGDKSKSPMAQNTGETR